MGTQGYAVGVTAPSPFTVGPCSSLSPLQPLRTSHHLQGCRALVCSPQRQLLPVLSPAHTVLPSVGLTWLTPSDPCAPRGPPWGGRAAPGHGDSCALSPEVSHRAVHQAGSSSCLLEPAKEPTSQGPGVFGDLLCFSRGESSCLLPEGRCLAWRSGLSVQCADAPTGPCRSLTLPSGGSGDPSPLSRGLSSPRCPGWEAPWAPLLCAALSAPSPWLGPCTPVALLPPSPRSLG